MCIYIYIYINWRIIRKCAPFNTTKSKCYLCLNEKLEIASYKGDILLKKRSELITSVDTRTNLPFYGMITRTNRFHCDLSRCISIGAHVLACAVYVLRIWFSKQKLGSSKRRFHWRILRGIIPVKTTRK